MILLVNFHQMNKKCFYCVIELETCNTMPAVFFLRNVHRDIIDHNIDIIRLPSHSQLICQLWMELQKKPSNKFSTS